jgi:hypothetical protein
MVVSRITRVSNPRKRRRLNPKRMSLKQKLNFGTKRQRAAAKASLSRKRSNPKRKRSVARKTRRRTVARRTNVRRRRRVAANPVRRRRRRANPAHILSLGLLNPRPSTGRRTKRRKKNMAVKTKRRRRSAKSNTRRRRRNSVKVIVRRRRRRASASNPRRRRRASSNPRRRSRRMNSRRRSYGRRRNPQMFGRQMNAFEVTKAIGGGLAGVAITKAVPNMLPASLVSSSPFMTSITSIVVAVGSGMLVKAILKSDPIIGDAVMFGGLMQAGSVLLNAFLPSVGTVLGLQGLGNGMGDLVAARFPIPQNPIMAGQSQGMIAAPAVTPSAAHAASSAAAAGVGAIYNPFGRAM